MTQASVRQRPPWTGSTPLGSTRGQKGRCPQNQRLYLPCSKEAQKQLEEEQVTYFTGWLKKKKKKKNPHEIQNLEIDAERPVTPPRPGWHTRRSIPGSRRGEPSPGLAFSSAAALQHRRELGARGGGRAHKIHLLAAVGAMLRGALVLESLMSTSSPSPVVLLSPLEPGELAGPPGKRAGGPGGWEAMGSEHVC